MTSTRLFLHVTTVLYAEGTDPQVLQADRLPSRVVAATPSGGLLELMRLVGREVDVPIDEGAARPTREQALEGLRRFLLGELGGKVGNFDLVESGSDEIPSIPRGNTYIEPFGPDVNPDDDFAYGFPIGRSEVLQESGAFDAVLKNPPLVEGDAPRIWARYHVILSNVAPVDPTTIPLEVVQGEEARARSLAQSATHGRERYRVADEVLHFVDGLFASKGSNVRDRAAMAEQNEDEPLFVRMFPTDVKDVNYVSVESPRAPELDKVARAMLERPGSERSSAIPAGHAFFGQFLTHEVTRAERGNLSMQRATVDLPVQLSTPYLDMASLYGGGPRARPELYESDGLHLRVGKTSADAEGMGERACDLPRRAGSAQAVIADARNDSNLAVAQMHVAMLRFHNAVVDRLLAQGTAPQDCFDQACAEVQRSVQAVTWHDFLRRVCQPAAYADAQARVGSEGYHPRDWRPADGDPGMPLEFSVAAFRLGHSLIKNDYLWNDLHESSPEFGRADLHQLFRMTGPMSLGGAQRLPDSWVIDWSRFVPQPRADASEKVQQAGALDAYASAAMHSLPPHLSAIGNLPKLNLMRGDRLALPSGEQVAREMGVDRAEFVPCGDASDPVGQALKEARSLKDATPLWLYVLREAELLEGGQHLGEVGSRIVLDTLGVLIDRSPHSIFRAPDWQPCWTDCAASQLELGDLLQAAGLMS